MLNITQLVGFGVGVSPVFATWNPSDKSANVTLSGANLVAASNTTATWESVRATQGKSSGKWYYELTTTAGDAIIGFADSGFSLATFLGNSASSAGLYSSYLENGITDTGASPPAQIGTFQFALDLSAGKAWVGKAGTWYGGDPVAGTSPAFTWSGGTLTLYPAASVYDTGTSGTITANFGASTFVNSVPSGFNGGWFQ